MITSLSFYHLASHRQRSEIMLLFIIIIITSGVAVGFIKFHERYGELKSLTRDRKVEREREGERERKGEREREMRKRKKQ